MADEKISEMPSALTLTGAELIPLIQGGANVQATLDVIAAYDRAYGAWSSTVDQTGSTTAGTAITFNLTDVSDGIILANGSELVVPNDGEYNLQFSAQFKNTDNSQHEAVVWIKINGSDLANSSTQYTISARKSASVFGYNVASLTFLLDLNAADTVEVYWAPTNLAVTIEALPASVSPAYPSIPSIIATMIQVA
jgi:hypothetical protein